MLYGYDRDVGDSSTCVYHFPVGVDAVALADDDDRRFYRDDRIGLCDYIAWGRLYDRRDGIPPLFLVAACLSVIGTAIVWIYLRDYRGDASEVAAITCTDSLQSASSPGPSARGSSGGAVGPSINP